MNVLADYGGHSDLYYSLCILFERRLGWNLFFPLGKDWVEKGFVTKHFPLVEEEKAKRSSEIEDGIRSFYRKMEPNDGFYTIRGIEFEKFLELDFDVILTTTYYQEKPFCSLVKQHKPQAKFIRQIANIREKSLGHCKNMLLGAAYCPADYEGRLPEKEFKIGDQSFFIYYPEQYEGYRYTEPRNHKVISNFAPHLSKEDLHAWNTIKEVLEPEGFVFNLFGEQFSSNETCPHTLLPETMKEAGFIWYTKPHGGGGYTLRQALASGRPIIGRKRYSSTYTAVECELYKHGLNCIDVDLIKRGNSYDISLILDWANPVNHISICQRVADEFAKDTKFAQTAIEIGTWIKQLPKGAK